VEVAGERALWCTDWPHVRYEKSTMANDGDLLELLYRFAPDATMRRRILVDNPQTLFRFDEELRKP
jgi:predicted TIM-barrel fold metal-dependent hydrolase